MLTNSQTNLEGYWRVQIFPTYRAVHASRLLLFKKFGEHIFLSARPEQRRDRGINPPGRDDTVADGAIVVYRCAIACVF